MDNTILNKIIATKIMGLVEQVDFGEWDEHKWQLDDDGEIDEWAFDYEYHNGPSCERCYHSYCMHCGDSEENKKCIVKVPDYLGSENLARKVFNKINENDKYWWELSYSRYNKTYTFRIYFKNEDGDEDNYARSCSSISEAICFTCLDLLNIEY